MKTAENHSLANSTPIDPDERLKAILDRHTLEPIAEFWGLPGPVVPALCWGMNDTLFTIEDDRPRRVSIRESLEFFIRYSVLADTVNSSGLPIWLSCVLAAIPRPEAPTNEPGTQEASGGAEAAPAQTSTAADADPRSGEKQGSFADWLRQGTHLSGDQDQTASVNLTLRHSDWQLLIEGVQKHGVSIDEAVSDVIGNGDELGAWVQSKRQVEDKAA